MYPGQVTTVVVRWAPQDPSKDYFPFIPNDTTLGSPSLFDYVWHCHIIDHEDNEMMRPDQVIPYPGAVRQLTIGFDY